eukprot:CAMPEP_0198236430 /NCGR_PEP_ID=MMETSP1446-20131203/2296_1 /TAXON_ID=1461542 ORGANISM="Unidentified sp, Strain CCMP2111" /NCGR_SAMPLE_ID=MMETSP1446 /ASSEMBLY_ACC=CAM_ASM_001112 /LENGTH=621 /DNA_ID=CAMNT_0043918145 /DNA_START=331 /DNA_END=2196 /DNA_ORIENTATION=-
MDTSSSAPVSRAVVPPQGRCINPRHRQPCWTCKLPPSKEKEKLYELVGDDTHPKGADKLKQHILESPEWDSEGARMHLAKKFETLCGMERLNAGLCAKDLDNLLEDDLLNLCRGWRFRSDIWQLVSEEPESSKGKGKLPESALDKAACPFKEGTVSGFHLRCIDPDHSSPCKICKPAPEEKEEYKFMLVGDQGRKNGEKKLRKFIQMTREWNSHEVRKETSAKFKNRPDLQVFCKVVKNKEAANLRKPHLIRLCREWNFKSNIWQLKKLKLPRKQVAATRPTTEDPAKAKKAVATFVAKAPPKLVVPKSAEPLVKLLSRFNEVHTKTGTELVNRGTDLLSSRTGERRRKAKVSSLNLALSDIQTVLKDMEATLHSTHNMFLRFTSSNETHMRSVGAEDMNVFSLISSAQAVALNKMKLDATKAELMRVRSQATQSQGNSIAWFEIAKIWPMATCLLESERTIQQMLDTVPDLFPHHLRCLLCSVLLTGLHLIASGQSLAGLLKFCSYGVYLDGLAGIVSLCSSYEDQVLSAFHHAVGVILTIMTSSSTISPALQGTIQTLLASGTWVAGSEMSSAAAALIPQQPQEEQVPVAQMCPQEIEASKKKGEGERGGSPLLLSTQQ